MDASRLRYAMTISLLLLALPPAVIAAEPVKIDSLRLARPAASRADEPLAASFSLARAGEFLDGAAVAWVRENGCASCHTNYPYLMARTMLGDPRAPALAAMRRFFEDRVAGWDHGGKGAGLPADDDEAVSEVVATAATLAFDDAQTGAKLRPMTRQALDRMWTMQRADGSWNWNKHHLPPQELDEYFGGVFAALGIGYAPEGYAKGDSAKAGVAKLKQYFKQNPPPNLHHKTWLLWASLKFDGLMSLAERKQTVIDLLGLQRQDGGWNLPALGKWKRLNGQPNDENSSDGYATGLVIYVLRQTGLAASEASIQRGVKWLKTHQRASGRWFTRSQNADRAHYITNAGTAYAVMALKACEAGEK